MTSFAPVGPLQIHQQLELRGLGNYNLLIASEILVHKDAYERFWQRKTSRDGSTGFVILDNGVIEIGFPLSAGQLLEAARTVNADVIILPDTIDDLAMTVKQGRFALGALERLEPRFRERYKTMGVVQGTTMAECADCAGAHVKAGVDMLAVPRGLTPNLGSRIPLVELLAQEHGLSMHLLGFSENIADDIAAAASSPLVRGIDAATPVWLGMFGRRSILPPTPPLAADYGRRPQGFWRANKQYDISTITENVERVRKWLAAENARRGRLAVKTVLT